jgi:hypothetical protein
MSAACVRTAPKPERIVPGSGVRRVPSVIETLLANPGKGVLLENVADPRSQPVLFDLPSSRSTGADG